MPSRIEAARFPARKTLEEFDFSFHRSIRRDSVLHLGQLDFLAGRENAVLLEPPGTGRPTIVFAVLRSLAAAAGPLGRGRRHSRVVAGTAGMGHVVTAGRRGAPGARPSERLEQRVAVTLFVGVDEERSGLLCRVAVATHGRDRAQGAAPHLGGVAVEQRKQSREKLAFANTGQRGGGFLPQLGPPAQQLDDRIDRAGLLNTPKGASAAARQTPSLPSSSASIRDSTASGSPPAVTPSARAASRRTSGTGSSRTIRRIRSLTSSATAPS